MHPDPEVMEKRFDMLTRYAGNLMAMGIEVYSPITHNHPIATRVNLPRTWAFWSQFDLPMLKRCEYMNVLTMSGWEKSVGVTAEINYCKEHNISFYLIPPFDSLCPPHTKQSSPPPPTT
jgi:hypothetical protein